MQMLVGISCAAAEHTGKHNMEVQALVLSFCLQLRLQGHNISGKFYLKCSRHLKASLRLRASGSTRHTPLAGFTIHRSNKLMILNHLQPSARKNGSNPWAHSAPHTFPDTPLGLPTVWESLLSGGCRFCPKTWSCLVWKSRCEHWL